MKRNIFCSRKGGATVKGKFFPRTVEGFLVRQLERKNKIMEAREMIRRRRASQMMSAGQWV